MRTPLAILTFAAMVSLASCREDAWHDGTPLLGAISLEGQGGRALLCGYNYELLGRFARSTGRTAEVRLAGRMEQVLDSLRSGSLDVVIFPYRDSVSTDSTLVQMPSDSCGVWVFAASRAVEAEKATQWLKEFRSRADYPLIRQPFFDVYNPLKRVSADFISPYDSLLRVYADTLGWDWKMLAAVIYQESKFHIEARSPRGAAGLMQIVPGNAKSFGCRNTLDPEENIRAGVALLRAIEKRYRHVAAGPDELSKFTLAAYNAGTGRLRHCINYARHNGADVSRWENVAAVIPAMQSDSTANAFKSGRETISYVRRVRAFHQRYRHICP